MRRMLISRTRSFPPACPGGISERLNAEADLWQVVGTDSSSSQTGVRTSKTKDSLIFFLGLVYAVVIPPGLTSFILVVWLSSLSAGAPLLFDPGMVASDFGLYIAVYIVPEIMLVVLLSRRNAKNLGRLLAVIAGLNLIVGIFFIFSTMVCGTCGLPPRPNP
jgi:hypothetical protein